MISSTRILDFARCFKHFIGEQYEDGVIAHIFRHATVREKISIRSMKNEVKKYSHRFMTIQLEKNIHLTFANANY